ncbi:hypothetical protein [Endothiovibrio diazotrophicus]
MKESIWLKNQLEHITEIRWLVERYNTHIQNLQQETLLVWHDTASKNVRQRYLSPHTEESIQLNHALKEHTQRISEQSVTLDKFDDDSSTVNMLSEEIEIRRARSQTEVASSAISLSLCTDRSQETLGLLANVSRLLDGL